MAVRKTRTETRPASPSKVSTQPRKLARRLATLCGLAMIVVAIPLLTPALNGLKPGGMPLGYAIVAHGIPLILATWLAVIAWTARNGQ
jgi:hypothetical protein